jgi:hypothetical protein
LLAMALASCVLAVAVIVRGLRQQSAENEFAQWFLVPEGYALIFRDGWWHVEPSGQRGA